MAYEPKTVNGLTEGHTYTGADEKHRHIVSIEGNTVTYTEMNVSTDEPTTMTVAKFKAWMDRK
jgi:hypothetical protein